MMQPFQPRQPEQAKVSPEVAIFIQLDEMTGRLAQLTELIEKQTAIGNRFTRTISVTDAPQRVAFEAIGYSLFNDGADPDPGDGTDTVYTSDSGPQVNTEWEAGLKRGDSESVDLRIRQRVEFWIACAAGGTATVRLRAMI